MVGQSVIILIRLQIFSDKSIDYLFGTTFKVIAKWGFGGGVSDLLTMQRLSIKDLDEKLVQKAVDCSNEAQKVYDEAGLSDRMIYVATKL